MDDTTITSVKKFVHNRLLWHLHGMHKEDCIQYMLMRLWEKTLQGYPKFDKHKILVDYLRTNGLAYPPNVKALTLVNSIQFDEEIHSPEIL